MEGKLEKFPQKISIDWNEINDQNAKWYERVALASFRELLNEFNGKDQEIQTMIEEDLNSNMKTYKNMLDMSTNAELAEENRAKEISKKIRNSLDQKMAA